MSLAYYFDHHVDERVAHGLRQHGLDVLLTKDEGTQQLADELLLSRAAGLNRVLVSNDSDFLEITARWLEQGQRFTGLVSIRNQYIPVGKAIDDLRLIAEVLTSEDMMNHVEYIPL